MSEEQWPTATIKNHKKEDHFSPGKQTGYVFLREQRQRLYERQSLRQSLQTFLPPSYGVEPSVASRAAEMEFSMTYSLSDYCIHIFGSLKCFNIKMTNPIDSSCSLPVLIHLCSMFLGQFGLSDTKILLDNVFDSVHSLLLMILHPSNGVVLGDLMEILIKLTLDKNNR